MEFNALIQRLIIQISTRVQRTLNQILHMPAYQRMEALWRGTHLLTQQIDPQAPIVIKIFNINMQQLKTDLLDSNTMDDSILFKRIHTEEFDQAGGKPFGLLVGDYCFNENDTLLLRALGTLAEESFSPLIAASTHYIKNTSEWKKLRACSGSRFLSLTAPRMLMREPFQWPKEKDGALCEKIENQTDVLWGGGQFVTAMFIIHSFNETRWFSYLEKTDATQLHKKISSALPSVKNMICERRINTDIHFTDKEAATLTYQGVTALQDVLSLDAITPFSLVTLYDINNKKDEKKQYPLSHSLCAARFAHYIKVISREKIGSFVTPSDYESALQKWLLGYSARLPEETIFSPGKYPLQASRVSINACPQHKDHLHCDLYLTPHGQPHPIHASLTINTEKNHAH